MANKIVAGKKVGTAINTIQGEATYSHTEREDLEGNWDDHWETTNGEFVLHQHKEHHVYIIANEDVTNSVLEAHQGLEEAIYSSPDCIRTGDPRMTDEEAEEMNAMERAVSHLEA